MDFFKTGVFWSNAVTVLYFFFDSIVKVYPNVVWISGVVLGLNFVLTTYFHKLDLASAVAKALAPKQA